MLININSKIINFIKRSELEINGDDTIISTTWNDANYMEDRNQATCDESWRIVELNIEMSTWRNVIIFIAILKKVI